MMAMVTSTEVKEEAKRVGFAFAGVASLEALRSLPTGDIAGVKTLVPPEEELPTVKSAVVVGYRIYDPIFNVQTQDPNAPGLGLYETESRFEYHQLYGEVVLARAWMLAAWLRQRGFDALPTRAIALKKAATIAGLGRQGKNTLFLNPEHGPRIRLCAVLTLAELEPDTPFTRGLCGDCNRCLQVCPTKALGPNGIEIKRCMVFATEEPTAEGLADDVREMALRLIARPTRGSFIECTICQEACPIGWGGGAQS